MLYVYNLLVITAGFLLKIVAFFSPKIKLFVDGRKTVFRALAHRIKPSDKTIWFHAASLGEYEQGLPVMEKMKKKFPDHKIILTFFSPSGYEVRKNAAIADVVVYLPLDTHSNAKQFLKLAHPEMAFFIKYEYWPNYLNELKKSGIPTYLISGIFRKTQSFFKWYGGFYRNALKAFNYFFVQNESSKLLLQKIGYQNVKISGDTRFDRVSGILKRDNTLNFIAKFKGSKPVIVVGSSWPKDELLLSTYINSATSAVKFIIAPHNIKPEQLHELNKSIRKKVVFFSEMKNKNLADFDVFVIDTVGILTKIYAYADIAYVGGGFGNPGIHNILEPAAFGIPIVIGPNYSHFAEAEALVHMGGCTSINTQKELNEAFDLLLQNEDVRYEKGHICSTFVQMNQNATAIIINHICPEND
ncbi:3-deoxy-D-manno-octulosonic acid transferase [Flavobacterium kingsejongi]|uniref:3-deoxy-D-manno-octulosonic acid transferase n=1 Tax=Flavobacterium kingsejongi TaxID=1678728 RepID=A0A2S1LJQ3_9FLAO|nr:glycosyltransferase N-terminal domain-containing protein [Flavobacterium kingsejongi]AWG23978.1 3-deoxy-D-manno-octulosonic acid transferase [Flavobacterium kingsejongi]